MNSMLDQAGASSDAARPEARPIGRIFPLEEDTQRGPQLRDAWAGFGREMAGAVRSALKSGRSPPEIAYAVGEIVHNYFRTRGLTLTSYELRRLVGELVGPSRRAEPAARPAAGEARNPKGSAELVTFVGQQAAVPSRALVDEENAASPPVVAEAAFEPPPSRLVNLIGREGAAFDRLLARVVAGASPSLPSTSGGSIDRERAFGIVDRTIDELALGEQVILPAENRERLARLALTEICGLGPIDRLLADHSVRAVFVDGPQKVYVERTNGARELASDGFRDKAHLSVIAGRLARAAIRGLETSGSVPGGIVEFQLRDGGSGTVIFPPAAPGGPVLAVRRGEPGLATLQRLITSAMIDRRIAGLLRIAARTRLNILITGTEGAGKTALLAAIMRDQSASRIVTLARHREFRWPSLATVELVAATDDGGGPSYAALLAAVERIKPDLLVLDSVLPGEALVLVERLSQGVRGTIAAVQSAALASALARSFDLVVRLGRSRDGLNRALSVEDGTGAEIFVFEGGHFRCRTAEPSFAATVRSAGFGESLYLVLR